MGQILSYQCLRNTEYTRINRSFVWEGSWVAKKPAWSQKTGKTIKKHILFMKKSENEDKIGQMLVSRALDRTKKIRKTAADIFAKSGPGKPGKNLEKSICSAGCSPISPWI